MMSINKVRHIAIPANIYEHLEIWSLLKSDNTIYFSASEFVCHIIWWVIFTVLASQILERLRSRMCTIRHVSADFVCITWPNYKKHVTYTYTCTCSYLYVPVQLHVSNLNLPITSGVLLICASSGIIKAETLSWTLNTRLTIFYFNLVCTTGESHAGICK